MGKLQSKHVHRTGRVSMEATECFLVNAQLNRAFEEQIWKKRSSQDLANYNMDESLSELSICLDTKCGHVPLRVELPPQVGETETSRVLKLDQGEGNDDEKGDKANNLSIEEFECGVQFEGTENSKQEWSFTLYDFDGHGRITKEDLASLLKALYDAVGSSIRLPPNGAKTLKLRLTVGQDRTQVHTLTTSKPLAGGKRKENSSKGKTPQDVKGTTKQQQFSRLNNLTRTSVKCNNQTQDANGQGQGPNPGEVTEGSARKQLSPEDQQQLVELVQENMERNHVKQLRRHHSEYHNSDKPQHKRRHRNRHAAASGQNKAAAGTTTTTTATTAAALALAEVGCRPAESQDRRNYYLDLAGVDSSNLNNAKLWNNPSLPGGVVAGVVSGSGGHHRSRSHDVSAGGGGGNKCDNSKRESENVQRVSAHQQFLQQNHLRSRSFDPQDTTVRAAKSGGGGVGGGGGNGAAAAAEPSAAGGVGGVGGGGSPHKHSRFRPVSLPGHVPASVSPHYHRRHRHREKDHDLAMQQVAAWIEREHSWDLDGERSGGNGGGVVVQRHHHHHIHEHHHHHHYHHYYEA